MRRWVTTWSVLALAATCWGRGVPMYREYSRPVMFDRAVSELSEEVALDEAQRLERVVSAARAGVVGEETALDLIRRGDSPFAERGRAGMAFAVPASGGGREDDDRDGRRDQWLVKGLKLESMTTTNHAILQGLGMDERRENVWEGLFAEAVGAEDTDSPEEGMDGDFGEGWNDGFGNASQGGGNGGLADGIARGGTETAREGTATGPAPEAMERAVPTMEGTSGGGVEMELSRVKEVLAQMGGGTLSGEGSGLDLGGGGNTGVSKNGFSPDWDTLLRAGSVKDLIAAHREGGAPVEGTAAPGFGGGGTGGTGWSMPSGGNWGAWRAGMPSAVPGGADTGMRAGMDSWGSGRSGGAGFGWTGTSAGSGRMSSGSGFGLPSATLPTVPAPALAPASGSARFGDWTGGRPAGGGYRPAWD